jgi:hypothetical protein
MDAIAQHGHIARLRRYEEVCNRYDIDAAVAMFTEDGVIDDLGRQYRGSDALRDAHEYDLATSAQIRLSDFRLVENTVHCQFLYCNVFDRALSLDGFHQWSEFTFRGDLIERFAITGADEAEIQRHRARKRPVLEWAQVHHPDELEASRAFTREAGDALVRIVHLWQRAHISGQEPGGEP